MIGLILRRLLSLFHTLVYRLFYSSFELGSGVLVYFRSSLLGKGKIQLASQVRIGTPSKYFHVGLPFPSKLYAEKGATIQVGEHTRINGAYLHAEKSIVIGPNCVISGGVNIIDSNGHPLYSLNRTIGRDKPKAITLGENVWLGVNVTILKGTVIGDHSVVAAGSVVKGVFPSDVIIQGNPAVIVKHLQQEDPASSPQVLQTEVCS